MSHRIVEISRPSVLSSDVNHLVIQQEGEEVGRAPAEDLALVILDSWGIVMTGELMQLLAEHNVAVLGCDTKHIPSTLTLRLEGHHQHARIIRHQIAAAEPTKKRLWQKIIQTKIQAQAECLTRAGAGSKAQQRTLRDMAALVRSGDPDNIEGQAARYYWPLLFGDEFLRLRDEAGINACLNYGYAVVRASVARALVGTGLHPALGIHHRNLYNAFALADDVMEPLRPIVDLRVHQLWQAHDLAAGLEAFATELTPALKKKLLEILVERLDFAGNSTGFCIAVPLYAASFKQALCREKLGFNVPGFATGADTGSCG